MALPALEKTWQYNVNNTINGVDDEADSHLFLLNYKNALLGFASNPYIVAYSCNGTTAGTAGDGIDRWVTTADFSQTSNPSSARSWMVLRNPVTGMEFLMDLSASNNNARGMRLIWSPANGFTGGATNSRPTATDEIAVLNSTSSTRYAYGLSAGTTLRSFAWHLWHSSDGTVTMLTVCIDNVCTGFWYFGRVSESPAAWINPLVFICVDRGQTTGTMLENITYDGLMRHDFSDAIGGNSPRMTGNVNAIAGGVQLTLATKCAQPVGQSNTLALGELIPTVNENTLEWELFPQGLMSSDSAARGEHGRLFDVRYCSVGLNTGDHGVPSATLTRVVMGNIVLPWPGAGLPITA